MKSKYLWFATLAVLVLAPLGVNHAAQRSGKKIQVVYQTQADGRSQVFIFGLDACKNPSVVPATDSTQPLEVKCQ